MICGAVNNLCGSLGGYSPAWSRLELFTGGFKNPRRGGLGNALFDLCGFAVLGSALCRVWRGFGADEGIFGGQEAPRKIGGFGDADANVAEAPDRRIGGSVEGLRWALAEVDAVVLASYSQGDGEFAGSGA